jgi:hypothetical protein
MAIDQRDVSSTLRFMDDRALQQYAAMYKNDPYIFPLAFQESQNRQRLRMSQQGAQGMQPQPKVNEQALAQMAPQQLPEDQGIATLAAPNMQQMADGGIAGYDDADFVSRSEPVVMMAGGGHIPRYQGNPQDGSLVRGDFFSQLDQQKADQINQLNQQLAVIEPQLRAAATSGDQQSIQMYAQQAQAIRNQINAVREATGNRVGAIDKLTAPAATATKKESPFEQERARNMARVANEGYTRGDPRALPTMPSAKEQLSAGAAPKVDAAPTADTNRRNITDPSATRKEPVQASDQFDVAGMMKKALGEAEQKVDPFEARQKAINAAKVKAGEENVKGLEAINKQFADINKGKKDRLDTREGEIAKMKDQSLGLALLNAGARMMQTRGSIGEAIGAGIDTGSKQYVAGLDKINAAKDKLSDARDRLEELEAQRGEMSARELHKARNEVKTITIAGMEDLVKAAMAERKMNRAEAIAFVEQQIKVSEGAKDRSSREGIARLQASTANRPGAEMQAVERIMAERKIPFTEALSVYKSTQREPVSMEKLRGDWLDMTKRMQIQADYPNIKTFEDYLTVFGGGAGGGLGGGAGAGGDGLRIVNVRPGP